MATTDKKVEKLRAVEFTKQQVDQIKNLNEIGTFSEDDKTLMESFKKIFHFGTSQLSKFISELEAKGKNVDEYTIMYYTRQLLAGPFKYIVRVASAGRTYWHKTPDTLGGLGVPLKTSANIPILNIDETRFNTHVQTLTKIPRFMLENMVSLTYMTDNMFSLAMGGSIKIDNTLPLVDKTPDVRVSVEGQGGFNATPHGCYMVCDADSYNDTQGASGKIFEELKEYVGEEDYRLYEFNIAYNPYSETSNKGTTASIVIERPIIYEKEDPNTGKSELHEAVVPTDIGGSTFESDKGREFSIKIQTPTTSKTLKLHTVEGQLGGVEEIKKDPISE